MKISTRGRYGLLAMVDIASQNNEESIKLKSIAERQGISENYLEQLIAVLKKAGFVKSVRGSKGGYLLDKRPEDISVGDILRVLEGSLYPVECVSDEGEASCGEADCESCVTKGVWEKMYESLSDVVDSISIRDLVEMKVDG